MAASEVVIEVTPAGASDARPVASVGPDEPPGSISNYATGHREVLIFGWYEGRPGVWRSEFGVDVDVENPAVREITSTGFELLADLARQPSYETDYVSALGHAGRVRFRLVEEEQR